MRRFLLAAILLLALNPTNATAATLEESLAGTPPYRRLFLDAMVVEDSAGLERVFPPPAKYEGNPVIRKDKPWEGWGPYLYGTVMWDEGKLKMWYQTIGDKSVDVCYAESADGINWLKPNLGIIAYDGSTVNNALAPNRTVHIPSVIKLPQSQPGAQRWGLYNYGYDRGACVFQSSDGLHWNLDKPAGEHLYSSSDVTNHFWDPYQRRFVVTYKTTNRRHRAVGVAFSKDGLKWTKPIDEAVFGADDNDPDATQIYGMPVFPYQGLYIGLPWVYHARWIKYGRYTDSKVMEEAQKGSPTTVDVQLAWSWNLITWTRPPEREPFIPLGPKGGWEGGQVYTARAPVIVGDKLYFYYGGFNTLHNDTEGNQGAIGLATMRLDGFCAMKAGGSEGWLISRREVFKTPQVTINAATRDGGYVTAELLDRNNNVIKGFSRDECIPFSGDSVRHVLQWKTKQFPSGLLKSDKKIRFYLKNAELYSYLPVDIDTAIDDSNPDH